MTSREPQKSTLESRRKPAGFGSDTGSLEGNSVSNKKPSGFGANPVSKYVPIGFGANMDSETTFSDFRRNVHPKPNGNDNVYTSDVGMKSSGFESSSGMKAKPLGFGRAPELDVKTAGFEEINSGQKLAGFGNDPRKQKGSSDSTIKSSGFESSLESGTGLSGFGERSEMSKKTAGLVGNMDSRLKSGFGNDSTHHAGETHSRAIPSGFGSRANSHIKPAGFGDSSESRLKHAGFANDSGSFGENFNSRQKTTGFGRSPDEDMSVGNEGYFRTR